MTSSPVPPREPMVEGWPKTLLHDPTVPNYMNPWMVLNEDYESARRRWPAPCEVVEVVPSRGNPYGEASEEELERRLDEAFRFRDWDTVTWIQDELRRRKNLARSDAVSTEQSKVVEGGRKESNLANIARACGLAEALRDWKHERREGSVEEIAGEIVALLSPASRGNREREEEG